MARGQEGAAAGFGISGAVLICYIAMKSAAGSQTESHIGFEGCAPISARRSANE
jgi:hypothetical protein